MSSGMCGIMRQEVAKSSFDRLQAVCPEIMCIAAEFWIVNLKCQQHIAQPNLASLDEQRFSC